MKNMDSYKIAFIYGLDDEKNNFSDGQIHMVGEMEDGFLHSKILLDYAQEHYPDMPIFNQLNVRHQPEVIAYFLVKMGHIVFFNTTKYDEDNLEKYGRLGFFMMPDGITKKQVSALIRFSEIISEFNVFITHHIEMKDGLLDSMTCHSPEKIEPEQLIRQYLDSYAVIIEEKEK